MWEHYLENRHQGVEGKPGGKGTKGDRGQRWGGKPSLPDGIKLQTELPKEMGGGRICYDYNNPNKRCLKDAACRFKHHCQICLQPKHSWPNCPELAKAKAGMH